MISLALLAMLLLAALCWLSCQSSTMLTVQRQFGLCSCFSNSIFAQAGNPRGSQFILFSISGLPLFLL